MQIKIIQLSKQYEKNEPFALQEVSLEIEKGEFIAVLGLSGSGKSTLVRCINRLVEPTSGKIIFEGQEITDKSGGELRHYRRNLSMIFQHYNLIPRTTVDTNVMVGRFGYLSSTDILLSRFSEEDYHKREEVLRKVGLTGFSKRKISTLSGGQQQRVGIARALMQQPKVILGDEPVSSLDPVTAEEVMSLLQKINTEDEITMLINLHSVELAKTYARRAIGIREGRIVFDGPPKNINDSVMKTIYQ